MIVGVVSLSADAPDKPYKAKRGSAWVTQVRAGTTTRDATDRCASINSRDGCNTTGNRGTACPLQVTRMICSRRGPTEIQRTGMPAAASMVRTEADATR